MKSTSLVYRAVLVIMLLAALLGIYYTARWMRADLIVDEVLYQTEQWAAAGSVPNLETWQWAEAELRRAERLDPRKANTHRLLGVVQEWRPFVQGAPLTASQRVQFRNRAIDHYRDSARLRPAWPDVWAYLARQKAAMSLLDDEFSLALERADTLGQWQSRVQLYMAEIGAGAWEQLNAEDRQRVVAAVERAFSLPGNSNALLAQFRTMNTMDFLTTTLCPQLDLSNATERARQACQ